ncbi:MAG TPA: hypothetical protein VJ775_06025 [Sphingomicrobium sp.]|nr:hypothetical protein [Sphingomicrobium sp.]
MTRRYAEDTDVPVGRSQDQVKDLLRKAGAERLAVYEDVTWAAVAFGFAGRLYRLDVPRPTGKSAAQEERRAWRLLLLLVKAKLEAVREGATTVEREFMADTLMPDGSKLADYAAPQLEAAYRSGVMPTLLIEGPRH